MLLLRFAVVLAVSFLALVAPSAVSFAAQDRPRRDPQAVAIVSQSFIAMGGHGLQAIHSDQSGFIASGIYTDSRADRATTFPMRLKVRGLHVLRREIDTPDGLAVTTVLRNGGWSRGSRGSRIMSAGSASGRGFEYLPLFAMARWLADPNTKIKYLGLETLSSGGSAHRIEVSQHPGPGASPYTTQSIERITRCQLLIDTVTSLPLGLRYFEHPRDWRVDMPMDLAFSDYRQVAGMLMPFLVTRSLRGQKLDEVRISTVSFAASIDPSEFLPEAP